VELHGQKATIFSTNLQNLFFYFCSPFSWFCLYSLLINMGYFRLLAIFIFAQIFLDWANGFVPKFRPITIMWRPPNTPLTRKSPVVPTPAYISLNNERSSNMRRHMFGNFFRLIASNVNSFLCSLENPEKMLDQALLDMRKDLVKAQQAYAEVTAGLRRMEKRLAEGDEQMKMWYTRAQSAMSAGDETLAKEALREREAQRKANAVLAQQVRTQSEAQEKLRVALTALENKVTDAQQQRQAFLARAKAAKTTLQVNQMLDSLTSSSSSAVETFARMKEKVEALEVQAEISADSLSPSASTSFGDQPATSSSTIAAKFSHLESDQMIEDEFQKLKAQSEGNLPVLVLEDRGRGEYVVQQSRASSRL
jgi:phage shock protein A